MTERAKELIIKPYVGVGPVEFGMTREQVRRVLDAPINSFYKSEDSVLPTDAFDSLGTHVYYKPPDRCEAVELFSPALPILNGETLIGPYAQIRSFILSIDPDSLIDESGITSMRFGVSIYCPLGTDSPNEVVEAVLVFEHGYYD